MANQLEIRNRIRYIMRDLADGKDNSTITGYYSASWDVSERTVARYLAIATEMMSKQLDEEDTQIKELRNKIITEEAETKMRSDVEIEAYLVSIIEGDMEVQREVTRKPGQTVYKTKPSRREILRAIDLLWKRRGLYRPVKPEFKPYNPVITVNTQEEKDVLEAVIHNARNMHLNK